MDPLRHTHTISYWQQSMGLPNPVLSPVDDSTIETELCIIGGGITGCSAAYLAAQQDIETVVIEARQPALGATGRNAGMILSGIADSYATAVETYGRTQAQELWQLTIDNQKRMTALAEEVGVPYDRCGSWLLADVPEEGTLLERSSHLLNEDGFSHEYTAGDPLQRGFLAGLFRPEDAVINPAQLVLALANAARAPVITGSPVTRLEEMAGNKVRVVSERVTVVARKVLLNINAYSALLDPFFEGKVIPCRGQIQVSEPAPLVFPHAGYSHFGYWYFRQVPLADNPSLGRWLIGGGRHLHFDTENNIFDDNTTAAIQSDIEGYTGRYFPELAQVPIAHRWAGTMGFTADGLPLVGALPSLPNVYYCVGFNGHGMGLGLMVTERAMALALEGRHPGIFDASRLDGLQIQKE
jgi:gamma-glutamylputrescine oxidase